MFKIKYCHKIFDIQQIRVFVLELFYVISTLYDMLIKKAGFADTAAIIENLDLIISIDTSVAHLAGAIGKPVWLLVSYIPDWRWMLERSDSPWYPTMKLFRQSKLGDWDSVFEEVIRELENL